VSGEPGPALHPAARRVVDAVGVPDVLDRLAAVPGADLTSFLLELMQRRAAERSPAAVLQQYRRDRFVAPAPTDLRSLRGIEDRFVAGLPEVWDAVTLAPLAPLGAHRATGDIAQGRVVTTTRGTEVAADPTNALALEAAERRRRDPGSVVRLASVQRVTRAQRFSGPGSYAHFTLFALVSAGRGAAFESDALGEHLRIHLAGALASGATSVRVLLIDLAGGRWDSRFRELEAEMAGGVVTFERGGGRNHGAYYREVNFNLHASFGGPQLELSDGGFTDWTARLLSRRDESVCISGTGLDRIAAALAGDLE
jgi:hypothetical protein